MYVVPTISWRWLEPPLAQRHKTAKQLCAKEVESLGLKEVGE